MPNLYIGLMSGTSIDSIDAALVDFDAQPPQLLATSSTSIPTGIQATIRRLGRNPSDNAIQLLGEVDQQLGHLFASAAARLLASANIDKSEIRAIGSHGQTILHRPSGDHPFTLQVADPNRISQLTGITTVADFRRRDMAAGGQGAPLVPPFHSVMFRSGDENRVVVNIGGIANITLLPADDSLPVTGFDTGPGNTLMDAWIRDQQGEAFDADGAWASQGVVDEVLLQNLLDDPYFSHPAPKSTGPEYFNLDWLSDALNGQNPVDVQTTLCALTQVSIGNAISQLESAPQKILVCGGGANNTHLMASLTAALSPLPVEDTGQAGVPADSVEAMAFAWLAKQTIESLPGNLPSVTGADHPVILGGIYPA